MQIKDTVVTHRINQTISFSGVQFLVNPVSDWIDSENYKSLKHKTKQEVLYGQFHLNIHYLAA